MKVNSMTSVKVSQLPLLGTPTQPCLTASVVFIIFTSSTQPLGKVTENYDYDCPSPLGFSAVRLPMPEKSSKSGWRHQG